MPIPRYQLDDRSFNDLVKEMVSRIPAHTPEWTNPQEGDPGHTLIDLFAWLADTILYRANLLPERQRLEFLRLLNIPMRPATAAKGLVTLEVEPKAAGKTIYVPQYTPLKGPVDFETSEEISVIPVTGKVFVKRRPEPEERERFAAIKQDLEVVYNIGDSDPYVTTPLFSELPLNPDGFDIALDTVDKCLWVALLAPDDKQSTIEAAKTSFSPDDSGSKKLNIGIQPKLVNMEFGDIVTRSVEMKELWQWEMPSKRTINDDHPYNIPYLVLDVKQDTTNGFTKQGIIQVALPAPERIECPENDIDKEMYAGAGNRPPRIDDESIAKRLVSWIRLSPRQQSERLPLTWLGLNAVSIDQNKTIKNIVIAHANGQTDQTVQLPTASIDAATFTLQVEEEKLGYKEWRQQPLHTADRNDRAYELDAEAGILKFGDGLRGAVPEAGKRIRVQLMRHGGGTNGNLVPGNLTGISYPNLKLNQVLATTGGKDAETLEQAEKRIPGVLKHSHRAITSDDYKQIGLYTPSVELGRIEVLPKFKPQQRLSNITGVISVMIWPKTANYEPPNPKPDRNMLLKVHAHLEECRPIGVELYVIGTEYVPISVSVAVSIRDGFQRNQVLQNVRAAVKEFLWPLPPGGYQQQGWPLGKSVFNHELEVIVARVAGVRTVNGVNLFLRLQNKQWEMIAEEPIQSIDFNLWQLPELLAVVAVEDDQPPQELDRFLAFATAPGAESAEGTVTQIPIPVVPEICR